MQKFEMIYEQMLAENSDLFASFKNIHDAYAINPQMNQSKFNTIGREIIEVIRNYERILCGKTESGQYGKFSPKLSERFWQEVRKNYPKIDFVGVQIA
ncbi:hypothetical protein A2154_01380 [Candidatus Gottesmanbacteria bacterium RBG_16_43_7]|uniref:Uncharacterized protein n=1 Tax=Candidatus Gottesmanbacteria bacterium RBG_16_43_7 TaxID=1798373 RepID=A0A1F5ZAZ1_9BACT|nr:MAG: hypothetical protein A2154_01380 [Candidatus Gottesmanbacteria bacterium RBG_16_43_7]